MANYNSPVADGRNASPGAEPRKGDADDTIKKSTQELYTGPGVKVGPKPTSSSGNSSFMKSTPRDFGNQVQFSPNPYGSGTIKDALNTYKQVTKPAAVNPGPDSRNIVGNKKAAGRTAVGGTAPTGF